MIAKADYKTIRINITTYKLGPNQDNREMDEKKSKKICRSKQNVCAVCLNTNSEEIRNECNKKVVKPCPICQKHCGHCQNIDKRKSESFTKEERNASNAKLVQTSNTNVAQGLNLLNEVLTVFQNKKTDPINEKCKSVLLRDVAVSTDDQKRDQSRLTVSSFQYSIHDTKKPEIGNFVIVNSRQPDYIKKSHYSIDLIKNKSSSIPQMKLEELKYSIKEKTRSKDAIEEVNRMFATVKKSGRNLENSNRPVVRSGPRVLPVVKNLVRNDTMSMNVDSTEKLPCMCCQTCMSSGDSVMMPECYQVENDKCDKCVYMLCCHYQNRQKALNDVNVCDHCRNLRDFYCQHENYD